MQPGAKLCITCTIVDELVLARSVFHHSIDSFGGPLWPRTAGHREEEKWAALEAITEHVMPGRWVDARHAMRGDERHKCDSGGY